MEITTRLARRFHQFVTTVREGDPIEFAKDLQIPDIEFLRDLEETLNEMGNWASAYRQNNRQKDYQAEQSPKDHFVRREFMYSQFVTDGNPALGFYDPRKRFAGEIKQLLDLAYNSYLPDAIGGYALTPHDSLPRS
ncbi:MAG: hypothetical protein ACR2OO_13855 [Thermomicrobiales bacterium]